MGLNDINSLSHTKRSCKKTYRICPKYLRKVFYEEERGDRENTETAMRMERGKDSRGRSMSGSYPHAGIDTTKDSGNKLNDIPKREKQYDAV